MNSTPFPPNVKCSRTFWLIHGFECLVLVTGAVTGAVTGSAPANQFLFATMVDAPLTAQLAAAGLP